MVLFLLGTRLDKASSSMASIMWKTVRWATISIWLNSPFTQRRSTTELWKPHYSATIVTQISSRGIESGRVVGRWLMLPIKLLQLIDLYLVFKVRIARIKSSFVVAALKRFYLCMYNTGKTLAPFSLSFAHVQRLNLKKCRNLSLAGHG